MVFGYSTNAFKKFSLIDSIEKIAGLPKMQSYGLYHSTRADLLRRMNRLEEAAVHYKKALALAGSGTHKRFLMRRLKECSSVFDGPRTGSGDIV